MLRSIGGRLWDQDFGSDGVTMWNTTLYDLLHSPRPIFLKRIHLRLFFDSFTWEFGKYLSRKSDGGQCLVGSLTGAVAS